MMMIMMTMRRKQISSNKSTRNCTFSLLLLVLLSTALFLSSHGFLLGENTCLLPTRVNWATASGSRTSTSTQLYAKSNINSNANKSKSKPKISSSSSPTTTLERYKNNQIPSYSINPIYGLAWIGLVIFAFSDQFAPGSLGTAPQEDTQMLFQAILDNPIHPNGINELFYCIFNLFAVIPVLLANIIIPQARSNNNKGLPAWPFLLASSAIGYFAIGIYLTLRASPSPKSKYDSNDNMSWFLENILENKILNWLLVAFTLYLPFGTHAVEQILINPQETWQGLVDLLMTSRVAAISTIDLTLMYISVVANTGRDLRLRQSNVTDLQVIQIVTASAIIPLLGTAIYCACRPPLLPTSSLLVSKKIK